MVRLPECGLGALRRPTADAPTIAPPSEAALPIGEAPLLPTNVLFWCTLVKTRLLKRDDQQPKYCQTAARPSGARSSYATLTVVTSTCGTSCPYPTVGGAL